MSAYEVWLTLGIAFTSFSVGFVSAWWLAERFRELRHGRANDNTGNALTAELLTDVVRRLKDLETMVKKNGGHK